MKSVGEINSLLAALPSSAGMTDDDRNALVLHLQTLFASNASASASQQSQTPAPTVASGSASAPAAPAPDPPAIAVRPSAALEPAAKKMKVEPPGDVVAGAKAAADLGKKVLAPAERSALKRENDAAWGRFNRALKPAPAARSSKVPRCPSHIADKIRASEPKGVLEWFTIHKEVGGDWAQVEIRMKLKETQRKAEKHGDKYATRTDLLKTHGYEESMAEDKKARIISLVDRIIVEKEKKSLWIPHPDLPDEPTLRLYKVFDYKTETKGRELEASKESELTTALDAAAASSISHLLPSGPSSSSALTDSTPALGQSEAVLREQLEEAKRKAAAFQAKEDAKKAEADAKRIKREEEREQPLAKAKKERTACGKEVQNLESCVTEIEAALEILPI